MNILVRINENFLNNIAYLRTDCGKLVKAIAFDGKEGLNEVIKDLRGDYLVESNTPLSRPISQDGMWEIKFEKYNEVENYEE